LFVVFSRTVSPINLLAPRSYRKKLKSFRFGAENGLNWQTGRAGIRGTAFTGLSVRQGKDALSYHSRRMT
jgi:hypothetical protein